MSPPPPPPNQRDGVDIAECIVVEWLAAACPPIADRHRLHRCLSRVMHPGLDGEKDEARRQVAGQQVASIKERLLENVLASRDRPDKGLWAANSVSLLNAAGVSLAGVRQSGG